MITLSFLQLLQDNDFGTIDQDLFFQKLTLDNKGLYISNIGDPVTRGRRWRQSFELFARGENDIDGYEKLEDVLNFLKESYSTVCMLPSVPPYSTKEYKNVTIEPLSTITNIGLNTNNRVIYSIQGSIIY
jgi:hypothetical protein